MPFSDVQKACLSLSKALSAEVFFDISVDDEPDEQSVRDIALLVRSENPMLGGVFDDAVFFG